MTFSNSIIARNRYEGGADFYDCYGGASDGNNLLSATTECGATSKDIVADPRLGPLQNNGGPTLTHALEQGSKALGAGGPDCEDVDQRGQQRDNKCDLGAFER